MSTAYLHVGMPKTGTSAIQQVLAAGDWPGHHYCRTGAPNHSLMVRTAFQPPAQDHRLRQEGLTTDDILALGARWRDELDRELTDRQAPNVILSGEGIGHVDTLPEALEGLRAFLLRHVEHIRVIAYIRPPVSFMESAFQQRIRGGKTDSVTPEPVGYRDRFERFDRIFGRDNVSLVKYDRATLAEGDAVRDLAGRIGLTLGDIPSEPVNTSVSLELVAVLFARMRFGVDLPPYPGFSRHNNQMAMRVGGELGDRRLRFAPELIQPVLDGMADDLDWIEARLGGPLRDAPVPDPDAIGSDADLLAVARQQLRPLREVLKREIRKQTERERQVAETLDLIRMLQMSRFGPGRLLEDAVAPRAEALQTVGESGTTPPEQEGFAQS